MFLVFVYRDNSLKLILKKTFPVKDFEMHMKKENNPELSTRVFWKLFERFISNRFSCQADLKLWNFRNVEFSLPEPVSKPTELRRCTTYVPETRGHALC